MVILKGLKRDYERYHLRRRDIWERERARAIRKWGKGHTGRFQQAITEAGRLAIDRERLPSMVKDATSNIG